MHLIKWPTNAVIKSSLICLALFIGGCHIAKEEADSSAAARRGPIPISPTEQQPEHLEKESAMGDEYTYLKETVAEQAATKAEKYNNLWVKLQHNMSLKRHLEQRSVKKRISWYQRNPDHLQRVTANATRYFYYIIGRLEARDMPLELALLPIVESAFQPFAYSPRDAAGLWQFIAATGDRFGLRQDWWYDGRRDVIAATEAALDYLQLLYETFDYSWYHALAAYNTGEKNVARAIKRNQKAGKPTDFWSLRLARETRSYVPALLALAEIVSNPDKYGLHLTPIQNQPYFAKVAIDSQIDLAVAAELAGISTKEIHMLNPGFSRWATDPNGPYYLLVPFANANLFEQKLAVLPSAKRMQWRQHKIKKGDTLSLIAHRYHLRSDFLRHANNLQSDLVREGDILLVPQSRRSWVQDEIKKSSKKIYTVKRSDSLWKIGKRYGVSVRQLLAWNTIKDRNLLRPGQRLIIRSKGKLSQPNGKLLGGHNKTIYVVKAGDSLWQIARQLNVRVADLRRWNNLPKKRYLQPGQRLIVVAQGIQCPKSNGQHCY